MNSTTVLEKLKLIDEHDVRIDILAQMMDISVPKLVAVLTELEHRDQIKMNITVQDDNTGNPVYDGTVSLMKRPPDEM